MVSQKSVGGLRIAALVADGFEQDELLEPMKALEAGGARVLVVSPNRDHVRAWNHGNWGRTLTVDMPIEQARVEMFDGILVPGGVMSPDKLRMDSRAVDFVRAFRVQRKPMAVICHGPWMIVQAGIAQGLTLTSYPSLRTDVINAGGHWVNERVVESNGVVTAQDPSDLPRFIDQMLLQFSRARRGEKVGEQVPAF